MIMSNGGTNCLISLLRQNPSSFLLLLPGSSSSFLFPSFIILIRNSPTNYCGLKERWKDVVEFARKARGVSAMDLDVAPTCYPQPQVVSILSQPIFIIGNFLLNVKLYYKQDRTQIYCIHMYVSRYYNT